VHPGLYIGDAGAGRGRGGCGGDVKLCVVGVAVKVETVVAYDVAKGGASK